MTLALTTTALGFGNGIAGHPFLVSGVHYFLSAALAMVEDTFFNVAGRNADFLAPLDIGNGALLNGIRHRFLDVVPVPAQEPFPVHCALVFAVQAPVDNVGHTHGSAPAGR